MESQGIRDPLDFLILPRLSLVLYEPRSILVCKELWQCRTWEAKTLQSDGNIEKPQPRVFQAKAL